MAIKEPPQLFDGLSLRDALQRVGQRGFTLRCRIVGGRPTWIAQVSRRGEYIKAQDVDPLRAVEQLTKRLSGPDQKWRSWGERPWKASKAS